MGCLFSKSIYRDSSVQKRKYQVEQLGIIPDINELDVLHCRYYPASHTLPVLSIHHCGEKRNQFFSASGDTAMLYDWTKGKVIQTMGGGHRNDILAMSFSDKTGILCTASRDTTSGIWENGEFKGRLSGHELSVTTCSIDGTSSPMVVTGSRDTSVRLWDIEKQTCLKSVKILRNIVTQVQWFEQDSCFLQVSEDLKIRIWDSRTMQVVQSIPGLIYIQTCCDISSANRNQFITGGKGFDSNEGCVVKLWDRRNLTLLRDFVGHTQSINSCCFVGSERAISVSNDRTVKLWDVSDKFNPEEGIATKCIGSLDIESNTGGAAMSVSAMTDETFCMGGFDQFTSILRIQTDQVYPLMWSGCQ